MNKTNIYDQWKAEEVPYKDTDLAKKTFSYRFPVHIAARLAAIEEMFPGKTRSEVIIGILKLGLAQFEDALPETSPIPRMTKDEAYELAEEYNVNPEELMRDVPTGGQGPRVDYAKKANAQFVALEKERGIKNPPSQVFKL